MAAWLGTTVWQGPVVLRISVSDQTTDEDRVAAAARTILEAVHA